MTHLEEHLVTFLSGKHDFISTVLNPFFSFPPLLTGSGAEPRDSKDNQLLWDFGPRVFKKALHAGVMETGHSKSHSPLSCLSRSILNR